MDLTWTVLGNGSIKHHIIPLQTQEEKCDIHTAGFLRKWREKIALIQAASNWATGSCPIQFSVANYNFQRETFPPTLFHLNCLARTEPSNGYRTNKKWILQSIKTEYPSWIWHIGYRIEYRPELPENRPILISLQLDISTARMDFSNASEKQIIRMLGESHDESISFS